MHFDWLLFDADGTLFDYDRAESSALARTFEQFGLRMPPEAAETYRGINGQIWQQFEQGLISQQRLRWQRFELLAEALGMDFEPEAFSSRYLHNLARGTYLIEGAEQVLEALNDRVGLMLITNGLKEVQRSRLARSTIGHYFADVIISEEVGAAKPHPQIFDIAFQRMGGPARDRVMIVGDSLSSDIQGGSDYGIHTCWFNPGGRSRPDEPRIDYEIADLGELLDLFESSSAASPEASVGQAGAAL
jgi:YjjG family noncanonical pyrimidine nucleotidase